MAHELESTWLYIHPPLAITGYALVFIFAVLALRGGKGKAFRLEYWGAAAWLFTLLGLVTGMLWAQAAWGSYWSWDPKETASLALFVSVSATMVLLFEKHPRAAKALAVASCALVPVTASVSWLLEGLHSFAG